MNRLRKQLHTIIEADNESRSNDVEALAKRFEWLLEFCSELLTLVERRELDLR